MDNNKLQSLLEYELQRCITHTLQTHEFYMLYRGEYLVVTDFKINNDQLADGYVTNVRKDFKSSLNDDANDWHLISIDLDLSSSDCSCYLRSIHTENNKNARVVKGTVSIDIRKCCFTFEKDRSCKQWACKFSGFTSLDVIDFKPS